LASRAKRKKERREGTGGHKAPSDTYVGFWAVAFLDLLGYSEILNAMDPVPIHKMKPEWLSDATVAFRTSINFRERLVRLSRDMRADLEQVEQCHLQQLRPRSGTT